MRRFVLALSLVGALLSVSIGLAQEITLVPVATGLDSLTEVTNAGDGSNRLFLVEREGVIRILDGDTVLGTPFLDIETRVRCCGERGLLGLTFHPDYQSNGFFYVNYTNNAGDTVVSRFSVSGNPNVANGNSEEILLTVLQDSSNHNGGQIKFGPDGYLYIGMGDGGGSGDPLNRAQNINSMLGKMLRIDVDGGFPYAIPPDNPYVGIAGLDEIWATGLRNPWRFSFDRASGNMYIADVGQFDIEEINFEPFESPGCVNYGWRLMEGSECFNPSSGCQDEPVQGACNPEDHLELPVLEYVHSSGNCSVTGGYVYRGSNVPDLVGRYLYADYCSGRIWAGWGREYRRMGPEAQGGPPLPDPLRVWNSTELLNTPYSISSFGEDEDGEVYVVDLGGAVYRIEAPVALSPPSGRYGRTQELDLMIQIYEPGVDVDRLELRIDGDRAVDGLATCSARGRMPHGGQTFRCPNFLANLGTGMHVVEARVVSREGREWVARARWRIEPNYER